MDDARAIEVIREAVPDFVAVYRFGSTARGEERDDSDVDLAVLAPKRLDPVARFDLQEQLAITLRRDVDLVDLRRASTVMAMQVVSRGKPIATGDAVERERFEDHVFGAYARLNEERREIAAADRPRRNHSWSMTSSSTRPRSSRGVSRGRARSTVATGANCATTEMLRDAHLIEPGLADRMMRTVGFRNVAVHDYTKLDLDVAERIVADHLDEFLALSSALLRSSSRST